MGFYYLLLRFWMHLGQSEFVIRLFSVVAAVASVVALYGLGKRLLGAQSGLIAALLLTLNAFHVRYSQEARSYTLLLFLTILSSHFFIDALEFPTARKWRLFIMATVCAFYTHFFAVLVLAAQFISLIFLPREAIPKNQLKRSGAWIAALCTPGILFLLLKRQGQLNWIPAPTPASFYDFLLLLTGQNGVLLLLSYAAVYGLAFIRADRPERWKNWFLANWLIVPTAILLIVSFWKPLFSPRYGTMALPPLTLLASAGLRELRPAWRICALILLMVLSALGVRNYYSEISAQHEGWRELADFVLAHSAPGDQLILDNGLGRAIFEYYRGEAEWPHVLFPSHGARITYRDFEGLATPSVVTAAERYPRVWLIIWKDDVALEALLSARFQRIEEKRIPRVKAQLYVKPSK